MKKASIFILPILAIQMLVVALLVSWFLLPVKTAGVDHRGNVTGSQVVIDTANIIELQR